MAYSMVTYYGMNEKVGNVSFYGMMNEGAFMKPYSEETATLIDDESRKIIEAQYERAKEILKERRNELELIANELLSKEVLHKDDLERIIGKRPFDETVIETEAPQTTEEHVEETDSNETV
jgi:cell division protease FtsH